MWPSIESLMLLAVAALIVAAILQRRETREEKERARIQKILEDKAVKERKAYEGELKGTDNCPRCGQAMKVIVKTERYEARSCLCPDGRVLRLTIETPEK